MVAFLLIDKASDYRDCYPAIAKSAVEVVKAIQDFTGSSFVGKFIGDGSEEIKAGCNQLSIIPDPTTPYRPNLIQSQNVA